MATYSIVHDLLSGIENAPSGTATFYLPGTLTPVTIYGDDTGTPVSNPVTLDSNGRATIYLAVQARMIAKTVLAVTVVDTVINKSSDTTVSVSSAAFTGTTLDAVLTSAQTAFGGQDFTYRPGSASSAGRLPKAWMSGVHFDVMAYAASVAPNVNDGVTLADTAIAAAVAAAVAAGGGVVYFSPGTYLISAAVAVPASTGITLAGPGSGAAFIKSNNATANGITATSCTSFSIEGLTIQHATASTGIGLSCSSCTGVALRDVTVTEGDFAKGVQFSSTGTTSIVSSDIGCSASAGAGRAVKYTVSGSHHHIGAGTILRASGTGSAVEFDLSPAGGGHASIVGCDFISFATAVIVAVATGELVAVIGCRGLDGATAAQFTDDGNLVQFGNFVDGYAVSVANGGNHTPSIGRGTDIRIVGLGATATVNAPSPTPVANMFGRRLLTTFENAAGGTTWTLNAAFRTAGAGTGIPTTASHRVNVLWAFDPTDGVWREVCRTDMNT